MESTEEDSWRTGLELEPTKFQPPEPGPVEVRIRKLEDMIGTLIKKLVGSPMTDEERAEWAKNLQGELPPVREGHDCEKAHPKMSHKKWLKTQEKKK